MLIACVLPLRASLPTLLSSRCSSDVDCHSLSRYSSFVVVLTPLDSPPSHVIACCHCLPRFLFFSLCEGVVACLPISSSFFLLLCRRPYSNLPGMVLLLASLPTLVSVLKCGCLLRSCSFFLHRCRPVEFYCLNEQKANCPDQQCCWLEQPFSKSEF